MTDYNNWTYTSREDADLVVTHRVQEGLLKCLEMSIQSMESDPLMPQGIDQKRSILGRIQYDVQALLAGNSFEWTETNEKNIASEIRFSIEFIEQSIEQSYANDIVDFSQRWSVLSHKENPFNPAKFLRQVYVAQLSQPLSVLAQKRMLMYLEKAFLGQLGFLFLELRTRFDEWGIASQNANRSQNAAPTPEDESLFNSLCDFLQSWEPSAEILEVIGAPNRSLTAEEMLTIVSNLQKLVPKMLEDALGYPDGRLAENIKESMLQHAEDVLGLPKGQISISSDDEQAVKLVDTAFTENLYQRKIHHASRTILAQILFPSVKASLLNRRWFAQENHPAREFIHNISEAVAPQDGNIQNDVVEHAARSVNQLVTGFNEDVSIFGVLSQEIQEYADDKKEKEWEALIVSREEIRGELRKMWKHIKSPAPVMDFALELGGEHLATLQQKGERLTPQWDKSLVVLQQMLTTKSTLSQKVKIDGLLRDGLMDMLLSCGWSGVRAHGRLAEQEDVIHAYYVLGQRDFPSVQSFPLPPRPQRRIFSPYTTSSVDVSSSSNEKQLYAKNTSPNDVVKDSVVKPTVAVNPIRSASPEPSQQVPLRQLLVVDGLSLGDVSQREYVLDDIDISQKETTDQIKTSFKGTQANGGDGDKALSIQKIRRIKTNDELLKDLKIGDMVEWINASDERLVLKLSYISPLSMKHLFVNEKGARILVGNPKELIRMMDDKRLFIQT